MNRIQDMKTYSQVLLRIGLQIKEGQRIFMEIPSGNEEFLKIFFEEAKKCGAGEITVIEHDSEADAKAMLRGEEPCADKAASEAEKFAALGAAYLRLDSPDVRTFAGCPGAMMAKKAMEDARPREIFRKKAQGCGQTIACIPGKAWADMVFPELPESGRTEALWETVLICTRCREEDPVGAWQKYLEMTALRKKTLDERHYSQFHYHDGKETDLWISPADNDFWKGSCVKSADRVSVPNIPTEEVFITPHKYRVDGTVKSTLPLNYNGTLINDIKLTFENGRITDFSASRGAEMLESIIGTDEGSHYIGEMAFVSQDTPIARTGKVFFTTLYDENASCHIAIGNALGPVRDPDEREKRGMNTSRVHVDFMVGSDFLDVDGKLPDGSWEPILQNGLWTGPYRQQNE